MDVSYGRSLSLLPSPQATFSCSSLPRVSCGLFTAGQVGRLGGAQCSSAGAEAEPDPCPPAQQHRGWLPEDLVFIYFALVTVGVEMTSNVWESTRL